MKVTANDECYAFGVGGGLFAANLLAGHEATSEVRSRDYAWTASVAQVISAQNLFLAGGRPRRKSRREISRAKPRQMNLNYDISVGRRRFEDVPFIPVSVPLLMLNANMAAGGK